MSFLCLCLLRNEIIVGGIVVTSPCEAYHVLTEVAAPIDSRHCNSRVSDVRSMAIEDVDVSATILLESLNNECDE